MLTLTTNAITAIRSLIEEQDRSEQAGLRIASEAPSESGGPSFAADLAINPEPQDEVVETEGARVFLDSDAAVALQDKTLDAQISERGELQLKLSPQTKTEGG